MGINTTVIPQSVTVDGVTIDKNGAGALEIKGGAISSSLLDTNLANQINSIGFIEHNGAVSNGQTITLTKTTKRVQIVSNGIGGIQVNNFTSGYSGKYARINTSGASSGGTASSNLFCGSTNVSEPQIIDIWISNGQINLSSRGIYDSVNAMHWAYSEVGSGQTAISSIKFSNAASGSQAKIISFEDLNS